MSIAVESDNLLREIRELRDRRLRALEHDLAEIDRAYEQDIRRRQQAAARHTLLFVALTLTLAVGALWALSVA